MPLRSRHLQKIRNFYAPRPVCYTAPQNTLPPLPYPLVVSLLLALLSVPTIFVVSWFVEHAFYSTTTFGWDAFGELALPLGACIFAATVFLARNPMHALLSLLGVFFATVLMYLAAGIAFVGLVFLIVYVGAVAVLFLFVIMLLNVKSLTSTDHLIQHLSQVVAITFAALLLAQIQRSVVSSLDRSLAGGFLRDAIIEPTTGEAVLFYVRYQALDINALTGLYTVHAILFMVITSILLAALLGAIILATVTTERATAVSDIRLYTTTAPIMSILPVAFLFAGLPAEFLTVVLDAPWHLGADVIPWTLAMISHFRHDGVELFEPNERDAALRSEHNLVTDAAPSHLRRFVRKLYLPTVTKLVHRNAPKIRACTALRAKKLSARAARKLCRQPRLFRFYAPAALAPICARRLRNQNFKVALVRQKWAWHWRRNRAAWLSRIGQSLDEVELYTCDETPVIFQNRPGFETWRDVPTQELFWVRSPVRSWRTPLRKAYLAFAIRVMPWIYFAAWRVRAFCVLFFYFLFILPVAVAIIYFFMEEYYIVWKDLVSVYDGTHNALVRVWYPSNLAHPWVFILVPGLLVIPIAIAAIALKHSAYVVLVAAVLALDTVFMHGAELSAFEFHESRCNFWRRQYHIRHASADASQVAADKERSKIHPDKGATDSGWYTIIRHMYWAYLPYWVSRLLDMPYFFMLERLDWLYHTQVYRCLSAWARKVIFPVVRDYYAILTDNLLLVWRYWCVEIWRPVSGAWTHFMVTFHQTAWHGPKATIRELVNISSSGFTFLLVTVALVALAYCLANLVLWSGWRRMYYNVRVRRPTIVFSIVLLLFSLYWWAVFYPLTVGFETCFPGMMAMNPWRVYHEYGAKPEYPTVTVSSVLLLYIIFFVAPTTYFAFLTKYSMTAGGDYYTFLFRAQAFTLRGYMNVWIARMTRFDARAELDFSQDLAPYVSNNEACTQFKALAKQNDREVLIEQRDKLKHFNLVMWTYIPTYYDHHPQKHIVTYHCHSAFNNYNHYKNPYHSA